MVAKFNGKGSSQGKAASKPSGKPVQRQPKQIQSEYSKAKKQGGSGYAGTS